MSDKRERKRGIFEAFLRVEPAFAGEALAKWWQPDNDEKAFPDIEGTSRQAPLNSSISAISVRISSVISMVSVSRRAMPNDTPIYTYLPAVETPVCTCWKSWQKPTPPT